MSPDPTSKPARASLNFSSLETDPATPKLAQPLAAPPRSASVDAESIARPDPAISAAIGARSGFGARDPLTKIDGRTLRGKGRTKQFNVKVTPDFHADLLQRAQRFDSVADYLEYLITLDEGGYQQP